MAYPGSSRGRSCAAVVATLGVTLAGAAGAAAQARDSHGFAGDGGPADEARLAFPTAVAPTADGGFLIADSENNRIRRVAPSGIITTVAGTGAAAFAGDGGRATAAALNVPSDVAVMPGGGFLIADTGNNRIRRVYPDGTIRTIAGSGPTGFAGDDGPATAAQLSAPQGVDSTPQGTVIFSDTGNNRIREVTADGSVNTVAGSDRTGTLGDGGAATAATLDHPIDVVATPHGFLVADSGNSRVRAVTFGAIVTIAGTGNPGFTGDVSLGPIAGLAFATGLALERDGGLLIADTDNQRIRRMGPRGTIMTAAGVGTAGVSANVADALQTQLAYPRGVAAIADGGFLVADTRADRVRYVLPDGTTEVVVGRGVSKVLRVAAGRASEIRYPWNFWVEANRIEVRRGKRMTMCLTSNKRATIHVAVRKGSRKVTGATFATGFLTRSCPSVSLGRLRATRYRVRVEATHDRERAKPDAFTLIVRR